MPVPVNRRQPEGRQAAGNRPQDLDPARLQIEPPASRDGAGDGEQGTGDALREQSRPGHHPDHRQRQPQVIEVGPAQLPPEVQQLPDQALAAAARGRACRRSGSERPGCRPRSENRPAPCAKGNPREIPGR